MKYYTIMLFFICFFGSAHLFGQSTIDVIYLKNGDVYKGLIIKDVPEDYLQIEMKDGSIRKLKYIDIDRKEQEENSKRSQNSTFYPRCLDINIKMFNFDYAEVVTPPLKSTEKGIIKGFNVGTRSDSKQGFGMYADMSYSWADETYDGSTQQGDPVTSTTKSTYFGFNAGLTYTFALNNDMRITPFTGYEMRSWDRDIQGSGGIEELYKWQNIPLGVRYDYKLDDDVNLGIVAQLKVMVGGTIKIYFSKIAANAPDILLNLGSVMGKEISFPISYKLSKGISLNICPYYEGYGFSKSNSYIESGYDSNNRYYKIEIHEPSSNTSIFGINLGTTILF